MTCTESVVSRRPVVVQRRVKWGDCDPAGVVFTAVFCDYVISSAELFYEEMFGKPPQVAKRALGVGTPTRALSFDFKRSLRPDDIFQMTVSVADIRERSFVLGILARSLDAQDVFAATLTPVCVARDERRSIPIPDDLRSALVQYQSECGRTGARQPAGIS